MKTSLLRVSLAVLAIFLQLASMAGAEAKKVGQQVPGYYRLMLGEFEVTALFDGAIELESTLLHNATAEELDQLLARMFVGNPKMQTAVNAYLINTGNNLVLIDTGAGGLFGPSLGYILQNLKASGYQPEQVDTVVITHLHGDHMGGLNNDAGQPIYPNAKVLVAREDNDFWLSEDVAAGALEEMQPYFKMARDTAAPLLAAGRWLPFSAGDLLVEGISAAAAYGHTPGHTAFQVVSGEEKMLIWGDLVHAHAVQFARPGVSIEFDIDQHQAIATRQRIMAETAASGILVGGMHLPFPGIGHVRSEGEGRYAWVPVEFAPLPAGK